MASNDQYETSQKNYSAVYNTGKNLTYKIIFKDPEDARMGMNGKQIIFKGDNLQNQFTLDDALEVTIEDSAEGFARKLKVEPDNDLAGEEMLSMSDDNIVDNIQEVITDDSTIEITEDMLLSESVRSEMGHCGMITPREKIVWFNEDILQLITLYKKHRFKFDSPSYRNNEVWRLIANEMRPPYQNWELCDRKFRNLKGTYKSICEGVRKKGKRKLKWRFFKVFHQLFENDTSIHSKRRSEQVTTITPLLEVPMEPSSSMKDTLNGEDGQEVTYTLHPTWRPAQSTEQHKPKKTAMARLIEMRQYQNKKLDEMVDLQREANQLQERKVAVAERLVAAVEALIGAQQMDE